MSAVEVDERDGTGISGTSGYGQQNLHPMQWSELSDAYVTQAGEFNLDLSSLPALPKDQDRTITIQVKAGHADVTVPGTMNVTAVCESRVGAAQCLGTTVQGLDQQATTMLPAQADTGRLTVIVKVNAGFAEVKSVG